MECSLIELAAKFLNDEISADEYLHLAKELDKLKGNNNGKSTTPN